ncbi:hypothetical protein RJT34_18293 [Clitoria ternatea]|uniref:Uncharacterized protein n=1 Tax=Clitoria ternatea TaxID=43366 RepID=A0AAN9PEF3_CLITE
MNFCSYLNLNDVIPGNVHLEAFRIFVDGCGVGLLAQLIGICAIVNVCNRNNVGCVLVQIKKDFSAVVTLMIPGVLEMMQYFTLSWIIKRGDMWYGAGKLHDFDNLGLQSYVVVLVARANMLMIELAVEFASVKNVNFLNLMKSCSAAKDDLPLRLFWPSTCSIAKYADLLTGKSALATQRPPSPMPDI